ncbi:Interleukin-1 receptor-associated kinase 1-binding protein 1 [Saguinus oedipus]|uniref:Interleukin-1 receptor-associated kinase 1-binding protein 1 n=1 Tax=Saguinus oedipus TaxID=9490 RepID=A0ABQ9VXQ0_SAGOE|nr:Interleukin-1 receptor-associated kinase 1-binding protein 1 [Saguinus oedipus]
MSLQKTLPTRVFVELVPWADRGRENNLISSGVTQPGLHHPISTTQAQTVTREVHVSGTAEVSAGPDRAQVAVRVSSTKEVAAETKKSVCRRLDYITQSLQQQGVQVRFPRGRKYEPDDTKGLADGRARRASHAGREMWRVWSV